MLKPGIENAFWKLGKMDQCMNSLDLLVIHMGKKENGSPLYKNSIYIKDQNVRNNIKHVKIYF